MSRALTLAGGRCLWLSDGVARDGPRPWEHSIGLWCLASRRVFENVTRVLDWGLSEGIVGGTTSRAMKRRARD